MKLTTQKAEIIKQKPGLQGIYEQIEKAGRTCYKSENNIQYDEKGNSITAEGFVDRMVKSGHRAMLEHATVYLDVVIGSPLTDNGYLYKMDLVTKFKWNPFSKVKEYKRKVYITEEQIPVETQHYAITTNYRVIVENKLEDALNYLVEPNQNHSRRTTFKLITSIGVTRELNRHRTHSIAEESTRYCNYSKDKFGNELTFIIPDWIDEEELKLYGPFKTRIRHENPTNTEIWVTYINKTEDDYLDLLKNGWKPQQAREVLPLCLKSEIIHTAFNEDWMHFFNLRYFEETGKVHPNMKDLATKMYNLFNNERSNSPSNNV